jgi:hypothetical protein
MTFNRMIGFKDRCVGETCVILGNGPSLKLDDIRKLDQKYKTLGSNKIYRLPYTPDYYAIADQEMTQACLPLPEWFNPRAMFIRAEAGVGFPIYPITAAGFSRNIDNFVILGGTVTYVLLQIAYYMGFHTVLLLGVDHYYPNAGSGKPGSMFKAGDTDPDHFQCLDGKPYFDEGKTFNRPELERVSDYFKWAYEFFQAEGRRIINLTPGTHLEVIPKDRIENWT